MANEDTRKIKVVVTVSDPPVLSTTEIARLQRESDRLHDSLATRTASMEVLTVDDLRVRAK